MTTSGADLANCDDRSREKLVRLRELATEAFDERDRGEVIVIEGEEGPRDFIHGIGQRAGHCADSASRE